MTTENLALRAMPAEFRLLEARLDAAGHRFRLAHVTAAAGIFLAVILPAMTLTLFLIGYFTLPAWLNTALAALCLALAVVVYLWVLHRPLFERPSYAQIARWIETHAAEQHLALHNELINAVLLAETWRRQPPSGDAPQGSPQGWIPAVLEEIDQTTEPIDLAKTVPWKRYGRPWIWTLLLAGVCIAALGAFWPTFAHGVQVLVHPNRFVPRVGAVKIVSVAPGDDTVLAGQPVAFLVTIEAPERKIVEARISLHFADGKQATYPMSLFGSGNDQYRYQLPAAAESVDYIITAGDTQSERYRVEVLPEIHLVNYQITSSPPAYTGRPKNVLQIVGKELNAAKGSMETPVGSAVEIAAILDMAASEVVFEPAGKAPDSMHPDRDGKAFFYSLPLRETVRFAIRVNDAAHRTLRRFPEENGSAGGAYFTIAAAPDSPPTVQVTDPGRDVDARPGDTVPLAASVADDYGLTHAALEIAKGSDGEFAAVRTWEFKPGPDGAAPRSAGIKHLLELPANQYKFGDIVRYRFVAADNRNLLATSAELGPQTAQGQVFTITLNDTAAAAAKNMRLWEQLRQKLAALLDREIKLRDSANGLTAEMKIDAAHALAKSIGEGQKSFRADAAALAKDFPFDVSMKLVQKSLQVLVTEDCTEAVDRAADLAALADVRTLAPAATRLRQHQSRIIDVLQALLAIAASDEKRAAPVVQTEGGDVPNEAKALWQKLADELKEFQKDQKQVISATADLAKKPKDQFDKADEQKLKQATALEDKWEKFLSQRLVDMSKIAEQDQANVSLLEELVQMNVELAMAKDALQQQALEIATPLEENGLENAADLTTHIERWLQQQPDRIKWDMEEMTAQNDAPMAELPKQLQDMVSDLMDQEEDLTDEMESLGSKWADSLDKGAGWDAADGPISNMSAQGVTGNQMPKNMEIQGRSGEGREGRTSGEFVGAEAEGKGGRRTPTRMTPEPFSQGQVQDRSKEPAGGATGGGKKSGWGGEGLEGPGPDTPKDPTQRLAGRQAALRNEAERLQIQARSQGFQNFKLLESAVYMQRAEDALKSKKYDNALYYQQQAVQSLNTAKVLASGQMHVTLDSTPTTSDKVQKEIHDALNGAMPKGYADPVKAYFERLSNGEHP